MVAVMGLKILTLLVYQMGDPKGKSATHDATFSAES
jgi:hypothetical protein